MSAAAQRTIEAIKAEIVLAKESYIAAVTAGGLARANAYDTMYATNDAITYDLAMAANHAAHDAAYNAYEVAGARLRTLCKELADLRAR